MVEQYVDNSNTQTAGCRYFEQLQTNAGWLKLGKNFVQSFKRIEKKQVVRMRAQVLRFKETM